MFKSNECTMPMISHMAAVQMMYAVSEATIQYLREQDDTESERLVDALHHAARLSLETLPPPPDAWSTPLPNVPWGG